MTIRYVRLALAAAILFCVAPVVPASIISYEVSNVGGSSWRYDYTLTNDTLAGDVAEATIFFDLGLFTNLRDAAAPLDWDPFAAQPDPELPDDGFFDVLAFGAPLASGDSLGGFSIIADFLGLGTPGAQAFEFRALDFSLLYEGLTTLRIPPPDPTAVPEPSGLALLAFGLAALAWSRRRIRIQQ